MRPPLPERAVKACPAPIFHPRFVLITGCSGGGKSTLLAALRGRGCHGVEEPGRRIVRQERQGDGRALPWSDPHAFLRRALDMALADRAAAEALGGWVFFDRGLIDAASALEALTGAPALREINAAHPYHRQVFLAPPWPEIYILDAERPHGLDQARQEYARLERQLPALGYQVVVLPKTSVAARADFVLRTLAP